MDMNNEKISGSICDEVRYAVSFGEELTEQMQQHLEECAECRTFLEQNEKMTVELASLNMPCLEKDGKSVADSVMAEIEKQSLFTAGKPVRSRAFVRHAGLIAACLILVVMAVPVMDDMFGGAKSADSVNDADIGYNLASYDFAEEESAVESEPEEYKYYARAEQYSSVADGADIPKKYASGYGNGTVSSADLSKDKALKQNALQDTAEVSFGSSESVNTTGTSAADADDNMTVVTDNSLEFNSNAKASAPQEEEQLVQMPAGSSNGALDEEYQSVTLQDCEETEYGVNISEDEDIYEVSRTFAEAVCEGYGLALDGLVELTYTNDDTAFAIYTAVSGERITLQLDNDGNGWTVLVSEINIIRR